MKNIKLLIVVLILSLFSINTYPFEFGFGTKGFTRRVLEKGQEQGKIPKTKEEKKTGIDNNTNIYYSGKINWFDLTQAKYLFVASKSAAKGAPSLKKAETVDTGDKTIFKIKENGEIEEVKIYDENGNRFDVNVDYIVKVSTGFLSVALQMRGVYVIHTTTQVVDGSTKTVIVEEYVPFSAQTDYYYYGPYSYYLVRLEDGAVYEAQSNILPNKDTIVIFNDDYGNFYYKPPFSNFINSNCIIKLNTSNMSWQKVSAEQDNIFEEKFWVDKYGNIVYFYSTSLSGEIYRYRKTTGTVDGSNIEHKEFYNIQSLFNNYSGRIWCLTDTNRDCIFFVESFDWVIYDTSTLTSQHGYGINVRKFECSKNTGYNLVVSSITNYEADYLVQGNLIETGDREASFLYIDATSMHPSFQYNKINLETATISYNYTIPFSSFNITDYNSFLNSYYVNDNTIYLLFKTQGTLRNKYSFIAIHPKTQSFETIFETEKYELSNGYWNTNIVAPDGTITINATDMDTGLNVLLKIIPGDPENPHILQQSNFEIYYLVRIY